MTGGALGGALIAGLLGVATSVGGMLAQASGGGDIAPLVSGGGAVTAVGGIVYIARLMATGRLVARDTDVVSRELEQLAVKITNVADRALQREKDYHDTFIARRGPGPQ